MCLPLFDSAALGSHFEVDGRYLGPGYGEPSMAGNEAAELWQRSGYPALDGTYSAKSAARAVFGLRSREAGPTLFWSTKSSAPLPRAAPTDARVAGHGALPPAVRAWLLRAERTLGVR